MEASLAKQDAKASEAVDHLGSMIARKESAGEEAIPVMGGHRQKFSSGSAMEMIEDLRRVQAIDLDKFVTRNYYRVEGSFSEAAYCNRFGTFHEFRREAGLEMSRGAQRIERAVALHASRDRYRGFAEVEILPWVGKYEKTATPGMKTMLVASDFHDKDSDEFVLGVLLDTAKRVQPDVIVLNGDVFDEYEFSHFDQDPRQINLRERYDFVKERIFRPLREACPDAQIDLIIGNHEVRILRHMADRSPHIKCLADLIGISLSQLLMLDEFEINLVSKGDLAAHTPKESRDEIKKNYKVYYKTLLIGHEPANYGICSVAGHTHKPKFESKVNELVGSYFNMVLGCISKVDVEYVQGLNRYSQGFGLFHIDPELRECVPEHIVFTDHYAVVGGQIYKRPAR
jgi:predicted phosphodiesterase